jgi:uroporphyrinogen III methyltransferase/synthase
MSKGLGKVYLVGAGPGDHELLTLKAKKLLERADEVIYDRLVNPRILEHVPGGIAPVYVGKASSRHTLPQDKINMLLVKLAKKGKTVVRLKGGDPFVFGRGGEEALVLKRHKIPFEIVPGITSAIAVPCYAGIPVTQRGYTSSLGIFTGQEDPTKEDTDIDWEKISTGLGTLVFLMGYENLEKISKTLIKYGRKSSTPCCLIRWGTFPKQRSLVGTLDTIFDKAVKENFSPPAILVVGEVVSLKKQLDWFEDKQLFAKKILVTVPSEEQARLSGLLEECGAECVEMPLIEIKQLSDYSALDEAIRRIEKYNWLIFTSQNGVKYFKKRLRSLKKDIRVLKGVKVACIGPKTKMAVESLGIRIDISPGEFTQEGLVDSFKKINIKGKNILIARAKEARDVLPDSLKKMGANVSVLAAYKAELRKERHRSGFLKDLDLVTFTSSSCVEGFFRNFSRKEIFSRNNKFKIASIGPITSQTLRRRGLKAHIQARAYTLDGLAEAIVKYYDKHN